MLIGGARPGTRSPGTHRPGEREVERTAHPRYHFFLEVRTNAGTFLDWLDDFTGESPWDQQLDNPSTLTFEYPADDTEGVASNLVFPNQIWLYDGFYDSVQERFLITRVDSVNRGGRQFIRLECKSILQQLNQEWIASYSATADDNKTISEILRDWLDTSDAFQTLPKPIRYGDVDNALGNLQRNITIKNQTILGAIRSLVKTIDNVETPFHFGVDASSRGFWLKSAGNVGQDIGQELKYRHNMTGITRTLDSASLVTRVEAYGKNGLSLLDAGESELYIDDLTAQGLYGVWNHVLVDTGIEDAATLLNTATAFLQTHNAPYISYATDFEDLSKSDTDLDMSHEALELGSRITVINDTPAIDVPTTIKRLVVNIRNPVQVKSELENKVQDRLETVIANALQSIKDEVAGVESFDITSNAAQDVVDEATGGSAGSTGEVSDGGHAHAIADSVIATVADTQIVAADVPGTADTQIAAAIDSDDPQDVGTSPVAGAGGEISDSAHVHELTVAVLRTLGVAITHSATTRANLPTSPTAQEGDRGITTGAIKHVYNFSDNAWHSSQVFIDAAASELTDGESVYDTTADEYFIKVDAVPISTTTLKS